MKNFSWQAPEYHHTQKTKDWYWTIAIISAALVITAVIFGNVLFGIVIAIGTFTLTLFSARRPKIIAVDVTDKGIVVDKTLYQYAAIESFSIDDHYHGKRLIIKSKKVIVPLIAVPLSGAVDQDELQAFLATHLKEEQFDQGIMQTLFDRLGF